MKKIKLYFHTLFLITAISGFGCNLNINITLPTGSNSNTLYSVGGTIYGLSTGNVISLQNNGGDTKTIIGGGSGIEYFTFSTSLATGTSYNVTVLPPQPTGKICVPGANFGTINDLNVSTIQVNCLVASAVNVTVSGVAPTGLQITNTTVGTQTLTFSALAGQAFTSSTVGAPYSVAITAQPVGMYCGITSANQTGFILAAGNLITVNCVNSINTDLTAIINSVASDGVNVFISYTISNSGPAIANNFNVGFWANRALAPTNPLSNAPPADKTVFYSTLAAGASITAITSFPLAATYSGTAYIFVDSTVAIGETNETNNIGSYTWPANQILALTSSQSNYFIGSVAGLGTSTYTIPVTPGNVYRVTLYSGNSNGSPIFGTTVVTSGLNVCAPASITNNGTCTITAAAATLTVSVTSSTVNGASFLLSVTPPFTFESGITPVEFTGDPLLRNWYVIANPAPTLPNTTTNVYASATILNSQTSCFSTVVNNAVAGSVQFDYSVDSEPCCDYLQFFINGAPQTTPFPNGIWSSAIAGTPVSWTTSPIYPLAPGPNTLQWCYFKDASLSYGSDKAWVDNIIIN
jgi:hypothetical protein